jgi:hypothetical protein
MSDHFHLVKGADNSYSGGALPVELWDMIFQMKDMMEAVPYCDGCEQQVEGMHQCDDCKYSVCGVCIDVTKLAVCCMCDAKSCMCTGCPTIDGRDFTDKVVCDACYCKLMDGNTVPPSQADC